MQNTLSSGSCSNFHINEFFLFFTYFSQQVENFLASKDGQLKDGKIFLAILPNFLTFWKTIK